MSEAAEKPQSSTGNPDINFFASTNFRNNNRKFGIKLDDRRRHMYVVGKTGMGKTTLLENMVLNDIYAGHGVGVVDPHGDFAEKIINYIPSHRINDLVYFNPSDIDYPIGFNILETIDPRYRHLVASGLMGVFKKIWPDVWSARMEYILNNTLLALLEFPNTTLLGINRLLADDAYRKRVVRNLKDPVIKAFWETEFAGYNDRYKQEAVAPVQNKIGQFLSASVIRNIVAQVKSRINIREIMDNKKIFIMNLSKGRIGEDNSRLLGGMLITKIQLAAMERVDTPEKDRKDFFLYVDEFQNFATESFSNILSEARKYRLDLTMAHQYMEQLDETVLAAVIGNVGTLVTFRVGSTDAEILAKEFAPTFVETDLVNLTKFQIYLKLMIDGVASQPFSANTLSPINLSTESADKVIRVSRERYATNRENIEDKIMRWTGMDSSGSEEEEDEEDKAAAETKEKDSDEEYTEDEEGLPVKIEKKTETPPPQVQKPKVEEKKPHAKENKKHHHNEPGRKNKSDKDFDIKQSRPVPLVDAAQKGISLSQAMQTNKQVPYNPGSGKMDQNRRQNIPSAQNFSKGGSQFKGNQPLVSPVDSKPKPFTPPPGQTQNSLQPTPQSVSLENKQSAPVTPPLPTPSSSPQTPVVSPVPKSEPETPISATSNEKTAEPITKDHTSTGGKILPGNVVKIDDQSI
ncbi:MAG: type IV secretion system DNA-binding domain-containing protein [Candidatus Magasanikbacteria bacterium]|nr:type IV secretion system DNA-binding domain-containing protein [Candidatus Magasanikbacteria bacterium]